MTHSTRRLKAEKAQTQLMGNAKSSPEAAYLSSQLPEGAHLFGLQNFGNTCYCNSVLQPLFHCSVFRQHVLDHSNLQGSHRTLRKVDFEPEKPKPIQNRPLTISRAVANKNAKQGTGTTSTENGKKVEVDKSTVLSALADLFTYVVQQKRKTLVIGPKHFRTVVGNENALFSGPMQQDAHEFLYYLLTAIDDLVQAEKKRRGSFSARQPSTMTVVRTWIRDVFEGVLTNETRCMLCERCTMKEETFWDLSVDLEQNTSLTHCLENFFKPEMLKGKNKFHCDNCSSLQEAEKRMRIRRFPRVLLLQLKRFKYNAQEGRFTKLGFRIAFPFELRLSHSSEDAARRDPLYELSAIIIHKGSGPNHGHYVSYVKCYGRWLYFDDETVEIKTELDIQSTFGSAREEFDYVSGSTGYILFYEQRPEEDEAEGLTPPPASVQLDYSSS